MDYPSIHDPDAATFLTGEHRLCHAKIWGFAKNLNKAITHYVNGIITERINQQAYTAQWRGGPITTVMYDLAYYCLSRRAIQDLWFFTFGEYGLMKHLIHVIDLLPSGYEGQGPTIFEEQWDEIHAILRLLLLERSYYDYDKRIPGYTFDNLFSWSLLIHGYDEVYPAGYVEQGLLVLDEISEAWTNSCWSRYREGAQYQKRLDPFFSGYFTRRMFDIQNLHDDVEQHSSGEMSCTKSEISEELEEDDNDQRSSGDKTCTNSVISKELREMEWDDDVRSTFSYMGNW